MITPLRNFAVVETGKLYRSAQPLYAYEYAWINTNLKVKTIVNLRKELDHDSRFCEKYGIKVITYDIPDHHAPTEQQCMDFINHLKDEGNYPILFHCQHGQGRTSSFSILCSLFMGLTIEESFEHERIEFSYEFKHPEQKTFLNNFAKKFGSLGN